MNKPDCTCGLLMEMGFKPAQPLEERPMISVSEKGKRYVASISDNRSSVLFDVDGDIIKEGQRCDKIVLVRNNAPSQPEDWTEVFLELKGGDANHAVNQLRETIKNPLFIHPSNKKIKARIIAASYPSNRSDSRVERARTEFKTKYNCELKTLKSCQKDVL